MLLNPSNFALQKQKQCKLKTGECFLSSITINKTASQKKKNTLRKHVNNHIIYLCMQPEI